jgi:hypothetical protein
MRKASTSTMIDDLHLDKYFYWPPNGWLTFLPALGINLVICIAGQKIVKALTFRERTVNALTLYLWSNPLKFNKQ